jgi:hypothetical protein
VIASTPIIIAAAAPIPFATPVVITAEKLAAVAMTIPAPPVTMAERSPVDPLYCARLNPWQ